MLVKGGLPEEEFCQLWYFDLWRSFIIFPNSDFIYLEDQIFFILTILNWFSLCIMDRKIWTKGSFLNFHIYFLFLGGYSDILYYVQGILLPLEEKDEDMRRYDFVHITVLLLKIFSRAVVLNWCTYLCLFSIGFLWCPVSLDTCFLFRYYWVYISSILVLLFIQPFQMQISKSVCIVEFCDKRKMWGLSHLYVKCDSFLVSQRFMLYYIDASYWWILLVNISTIYKILKL